MSELRVIAVGSDVVKQLKETGMSPGYGHPASAKVAMGHGPCRHCLRPFAVGSDVRVLFTFNSFEGAASIPQPGPVFVHEAACERYVEDGGYPPELLRYPVLLDGYDGEQIVRRREKAEAGTQEEVARQMLSDPLMRYVMVRDAEAGCFDFRIERREEFV